jgi:hypothetical protein
MADYISMKIIKVYDNGGKTFDRYTVIVNERRLDNGKLLYQCLGLSGDPTHPQGFSQWGECLMGKHLGKEIWFNDLPDNIRSHVFERLA